MLTLDSLLDVICPHRTAQASAGGKDAAVAASSRVAEREGVEECGVVTHATQVNALLKAMVIALKCRGGVSVKDSGEEIQVDEANFDRYERELKLSIMRHVDVRYGLGSNKSKRINAALQAKVAKKDVTQALADYFGVLLLVVTGGIMRLYYGGTVVDHNLPYVVVHELPQGYVAILDRLGYDHPYVRRLRVQGILTIGDGVGPQGAPTIIEYGKYDEPRELGLPPLVLSGEPAPANINREEPTTMKQDGRTKLDDAKLLCAIDAPTRAFLDGLFKRWLM